MKKEYEKPVVEIMSFSNADIITTSGIIIKNFTKGESTITF